MRLMLSCGMSTLFTACTMLLQACRSTARVAPALAWLITTSLPPEAFIVKLPPLRVS